MPIETLPLQPVAGDPSITISARQLRAHLLGNLFSREGVIDLLGGHMKVSQRGAGANFTVDIAVGRAAVFGDDASDQGTYSINSTTTVNKTIPAASTSTTRTHRVILQVRDKLEKSSWSTYDSDVIVQADTAAAAALPASSIALASVAVPANSTSVTDAMITDLRKPASVGSADLTGTWTVISPDYAAEDATRPLRWSVNADGWVSLAGWIRFKKPNAPVANGATFPFTTTALPAAIRPSPAGFRDMVGIASYGATQVTLNPQGQLTYRNTYDTTLLQNVTWWSFDGIGWKL